MATVVGRLLESSHSIVKSIAFDAHQSHVLFRQLLFGQVDHLSEAEAAEIEKMDFWKDCSYKKLPEHMLPHLPCQICIHDGQPIWPLPGACNLSFA